MLTHTSLARSATKSASSLTVTLTDDLDVNGGTEKLKTEIEMSIVTFRVLIKFKG